MKKLLLAALLTLSFAACTNNDAIQEPNESNVTQGKGVVTYTFEGKTFVYDESKPMTSTTKYPPVFGYNFDPTTKQYTIGLSMGEASKTTERGIAVMLLYYPQINNFSYSWGNGGVVGNKNSKITITKENGNLISGTFTSDLINGKFENIKKLN